MLTNLHLLTVVSVEDGYVITEDECGGEVLITPGPLSRELVMWSDLDLESAWFAAVQYHRQHVSPGYYSHPEHADFLASLRLEVADYDEIDVVWCENCREPVRAEDAVTVGSSGNHVCSSCYDSDYTSCSDCGNVVAYDSTTGTLHDDSVCDSCLDNNYVHCEDCDGYYHDSYFEDHRHGGCDCESPAQTFTMPNGDTVVHQDERFAMTLPSGVISEEGMYTIAGIVRQRFYDSDVTDHNERTKWYELGIAVQSMDPTWQTKDGNFTKRLSKLAHKSQGLKISPDMMTRIGNVARVQSSGADVQIELTRDLNQSAADFFHEDSCWWQSYSESRCALKTNGGIGLRSFSKGTWGDVVSGRAWIMPLRLNDLGNLVPTFDAQTPDAYMVFNGYGDLDGYTPARIVAQMTGLTYRKIGFECSPMYINNSSGYLVTSEDIAQKYTSGLRLDVAQHSNLYNVENRTLTNA